jgi:hypothetical protein
VNIEETVPIPPGNGCEHAGYKTIQPAVSAASAGDTIRVCRGTYEEQVTIPSGKDNLTLHSVSHWHAISKAPVVMLDAKAIVRVSASQNVTIRGFEISGPGSGGCDSLRFGVRVDEQDPAVVSTVDDERPAIDWSRHNAYGPEAVAHCGAPDHLQRARVDLHDLVDVHRRRVCVAVVGRETDPLRP